MTRRQPGATQSRSSAASDVYKRQASRNAAILAAQIIALSDPEVAHRLAAFKEGLKEKVIKADDELKKIKLPYKVD